VPEGAGPRGRRLHPLCVPTGRFCYATCDACDCLREGRVSTFIDLGSGPTSYWKTLKLMGWAFAFMSATAVPALVINTFNARPQFSLDALSLSSSTLAGLAASLSSNGTATASILLPSPSGGAAALYPRSLVAMVYALCDLGAVAVFFFSYLWLAHFTRHEERQVEANTISAKDYTVFLPSVPADTTEGDLVELFERVTQLPERPDGARVADTFIVEQNTELVSIFMERGRIHRLLQRLDVRARKLEERVRGGDAGCALLCGGLPGALRRLGQAKDALRRRYAALSDKATRRAHGGSGAIAAFVTFEDMPAVEYVVGRYADSFVAGCQCCQPKRMRIRGVPLRVVRAPPPSAILWGNLGVSPVNRACRQSATAVLSATLLVSSFVLLWFASWKQAAFA
jgi:hypothetical protein